MNLNTKQDEILLEIPKNADEIDGYEGYKIAETPTSILVREEREEDGYCECCSREGEVYYLKGSSYAVGICLPCFRNRFPWVKNIYTIH